MAKKIHYYKKGYTAWTQGNGAPKFFFKKEEAVTWAELEVEKPEACGHATVASTRTDETINFKASRLRA